MATVASPASPPALDQNPSDVKVESELEDGAPVTVFHDPDNFNAIHPLASEWTLWFTKPPTGKVRVLVWIKQTLADNRAGR